MRDISKDNSKQILMKAQILKGYVLGCLFWGGVGNSMKVNENMNLKPMQTQ